MKRKLSFLVLCCIPVFTWAQKKELPFEEKQSRFLQNAANIYRIKFTKSTMYWLAGKGKEYDEMTYPEKTRYIEVEIPAIETSNFKTYAASYDQTLAKLHEDYAEMWCGGTPDRVRIVFIVTAHYGDLAKSYAFSTDDYTPPVKKS